MVQNNLIPIKSEPGAIFQLAPVFFTFCYIRHPERINICQ